MAIFVEKAAIQLNVKALELLTCHSKSDHATVVCNEPYGQVYLIAEGNLAPSTPWKSPSKVLVVSWHPTLPLLAVGLDSGDLFSLLLNDKSVKDSRFASPQKNPIQILKWPTENQLLSLDSTGLLLVWNHSKDGHFQLLTEYDLKDTPSQMACLTQHAAPWECYIGCPSGVIYQIVQGNSTFIEICNMDRAIQDITSFEDLLCVLTFGGVLTVFRRDKNLSEGNGFQLVNTVKLSGKARLIQITWLSKNLLALTGGDLTIRLWDCQSNDTFVLPMPDMAELALHAGAEHFTTLAYRFSQGSSQVPMLAAATNLGGIAFWRRSVSLSPKENPEDEWYFVGLVGLPGGSMEQSAWGFDSYYVHNGSSAYQIVQQEPCVVFKNSIGAVQLSSSVLSIQKSKISIQADVPVKITGLDICDNLLLVWGDGKVVVYQMGPANEKPFLLGTFDSNATKVLLSSNACFCLEGSLIQMRSFQGSLLTTLSFMDSEGVPVLLDRSGTFLCSASSSGYAKLWELSNREPKLHVSTKNVTSKISGFVKFQSLKVNSDGTSVSFTTTPEGQTRKLYIWRTSWNAVAEIDVAAEWTGEHGQLIHHFWDEEEPRIVICQLVSEEKSCLVSLMVSPDHDDVLVHDVVNVPADMLVGVALPQYAVLDDSAKIEMRTLTSLSSLDNHADKAARDALLSFSCHLRRGRIEQAYQCVRSFNNPAIWERLARTCVQLKRPDVGLICLGKLRDARAAGAVRMAHSKYNGQVEAITAVLAVQLGMVTEAEELCEQSGSYELLNRMYQASNRWEQALQLAHTKDRINLKRTYYNYARYLEGEGKFDLAKEMFEKCNTHHFDVPRMLFDDSVALQEYCTSSNDPDRLRWWAQYLESSGEMEAALEHYARAGDYLSLVRLHCYLGDLDRATELAEHSQDRAACFHVARQHESNNNIPEALKFFGQAAAFGNAVRLCKEHELGDQLYRYAMQGDQEEMVEAARYFEAVPLSSDRQPRYDRAVILYSKAGLLDTALDLASRTDQHEAVLELARRLDSTSNPASLQRCANYLASHKHYDAAVDLLAMAGKNSEAIEMCLKYNVKLTEALAEQLTSSENNSRLLIQLAEAAQRQGDYQLAAKKFTQAGDKYQAMKALLKSGDTEKIVFFANVSRNPDIYILAGNYLQTLDWRAHPEYVKHIVNFYTKAKSLDLLAGFYEACAQIEVDEYHNYPSALNALKEAQKVLTKSSGRDQSNRIKTVNSKIEFLEHFLSLSQVSASNPEIISQFNGLLKSHTMELGILKPGDVYAAMFQLQLQHKLNQEALNTLNLLKSLVPNVLTYVNSAEVVSLCTALNIPSNVFLRNNLHEDGDTSEEIAEVIRHR